MDIRKEHSREAFEEFEFQKRPFASKKVLFQKYDPARIGDCDGNEGKYYCAEMQEKWEIWQHVGAQAVPDGFVLVPVKETSDWYLDDSESMYLEYMDHWACEIEVGEVVTVQRKKIWDIPDQYVAKVYVDEDNIEWQLFDDEASAQKAVDHCKAMIAAVEGE